MTIIRTTCTACGDVELAAWAVTLTMMDAAEGLLTFTCPSCSEPGHVDADASSVALLTAAGVHVVRQQPAPPALSDDDLQAAIAYLDTFDALCDHECLSG